MRVELEKRIWSVCEGENLSCFWVHGAGRSDLGLESVELGCGSAALGLSDQVLIEGKKVDGLLKLKAQRDEL